MLTRIIDLIPTLFRRLFLLSIVVIGIFYLRWLWLDPPVFKVYSDPTNAFRAGMMLLAPFVAFAFALQRAKKAFVHWALVVANVLFLWVNVSYLIVHMPSIEASARCNGKTYFITYGAPVLDEQWTYRQLTIWRGPFRYQSRFFGYAPGHGSSRFVCDAAHGETHIVSNLSDGLRYTDGPNPRTYELGEWAALHGHYYFLSWQLAEPRATCSDPCSGREEVYTLYECTEHYTGCHSLSISYTTRNADGFAVRAKLETDQVDVYQLSYTPYDETLIFTYGPEPRCFAEGCIISGN